MAPLCSVEIPDFNLVRYLNFGGLPAVYLSHAPEAELRNYVHLYLREEIAAESLARKHEYFLSFLDIIAQQNGEELSYQSLADDSGVPPRTIQNYVQILEDTLMGFQLKPFRGRIRKAVSRSKFYLFDIGVSNSIAKRGAIAEGGELFGRAIEHFVVREVRSYLGYRASDTALRCWRTTSGFEVDLIVGDQLGLEVKAAPLVAEGHLKGLRALREGGAVRRLMVVSRDSESRVMDGIDILPWRLFLDRLWSGELVR